MNKVILFLFFILFSFSLQAQKTVQVHNIQNEITFYFNPSSTKLGNDKKAKEVINMLLGEEPLGSSDSIFIKSFSQSNALTKARAKNIRNLLLKNHIDSTKIIITEHIQNATSDSKQNRRVDVILSRLIEEEEVVVILEEEEKITEIILEKDTVAISIELTTFFEEEAAKEVQNFEISSNKGKLIKGKKGTILQIPAKSFVSVDGTLATGAIQIKLQEAYSSKDIIIQNLETSSRGQLLETGGMIKLEAFDSNGELLQLAAGKTIFAVMATEEALLPEMQTFEGEKTSTGQIDWIPTDKAVIVAEKDKPSVIDRAVESKENELEKAIQIEGEMPSFQQVFPALKRAPVFELALPIAPQLVDNPPVDKELLKKEHPQKAKESKHHYYKRILAKYNVLLDIYIAKRSQNNTQQSKYNRDLADYTKRKNSYDKELVIYIEYAKKVHLCIDEIQQKLNWSDIETYYQSSYDLYLAFHLIGQKSGNMTFETQKIIQDLTVHSSDYEEVSIFLAKIEEMKKIKGLGANAEKIDNIFNLYGHYGLNSKLRKKQDFKNWMSEIKHLSHDKNPNSKKVIKLRSLYYQLKKTFRFEEFHDKYETCKKRIIENRLYIDKFVAVEKEFTILKKEAFKLKEELGLFSGQEIANMYKSALAIETMGWINCDRFYNNIAPRIDCNILVENRPNVQLYLIFESINSTLRAEFDPKGNFVFRDIPTAKRIKLVGIKIEKNRAYFFSMKGKAKDFKEIAPEFRSVEKEEISELLTQH